jgi:hypothetical protein
VNLSRWWRQARHIRNLTVRLNAKGEELYGAHRRIAALCLENEQLRRANARLAVRAGDLEAKYERNPS